MPTVTEIAATASLGMRLVTHVIDQCTNRADGECRPEQAENHDPVGANYSIKPIAIIEVTNHGAVAVLANTSGAMAPRARQTKRPRAAKSQVVTIQTLK
jgi:hypothetical protein